MDKDSKFIFLLKTRGQSNHEDDTHQLADLYELNNRVHDHLQTYKDMINEYYKNKLWDKYKKFANDFELVFTSCNGFPNISSYNSISRSFFKLWEILHDFHSELDHVLCRPSLKCCFLAEGPGGFLEAFSKFRKSNSQDIYYGMTLISPNKTVPSWKIPKSISTESNIQILYGSDGTGDIYHLHNIDHTLATVGQNTCDFITADGGFDFSNAFNKQEDMSLLLVCCEIYNALLLQKPGGVFVLKIFDICNSITIKLINILHDCYEQVFLTKPFSSRPANSEKYVICINFREVETNILKCLRTCIQERNMNALDFYLNINIHILESIVYFNSCYIRKQAFNILKTIICIDHMIEDCNNEKFVSNLKAQLNKAIRWCHQYNIPISLPAIKKYRDNHFIPQLIDTCTC